MSVDPIVYLHIGAPKTGTTYLQKVLATNRPALRTQGLLYPGNRADHFLAAQDVMGHAFRGHQDERAKGTWDRLLREVNAWDQSTLISHELFCLAQADQIARITDSLDGRDIRVILTARDLVRQIPAVWQEDLKNGKVISLPDFSHRVQENASKNQAKGFWGYQDLPRILARWEARVPSQHIYVVTVPPQGAQPNLLWSRFTQVLNVDLPQDRLRVSSTNISLGAAEAEFLRRLNEQVADTMSWPHYRELVKNGLVRRALARGTESRSLDLPPSVAEWAAKRSTQAAVALAGRSYQVVGDLSDLSPVTSSPPTSAVGPTAESDIAAVGVAATADLLVRLRRDRSPTSGSSRHVPSRRWLASIPGLRHRRISGTSRSAQSPDAPRDQGAS